MPELIYTLFNGKQKGLPKILLSHPLKGLLRRFTFSLATQQQQISCLVFHLDFKKTLLF